MDQLDEASQLLVNAQQAELSGDVQLAFDLYQQYYSNRPFRFTYQPELLSNTTKTRPPKLSIIVPCFNSEKYVEQCIDSILQQTFVDFELLLIDDCSSDNSLQIILKKALEDERIILIRNKKPSGSAGSPRNQALKIARGKLIGFVDSDDWIGPSYFKSLIDTLDEQNADLVISKGFYNHVGDTYNKRIYPDNWQIKCSNPDLSCTHMSSMIWDKVYKKSLIHNNKIWLGSYPAAVDVPFILKIYHLCQKPVVANTNDYHYRRETENSVTVKYRKGSSCDFEIKAYHEIFEWAVKNKIPNSYLNFMRLKRLASFIYTCKLVRIDFFSSYFDRCSSILVESRQDFSENILSASGQRSLDDCYQLFLTRNKQKFIYTQRSADKVYLIKDKKGQFDVANTILPAYRLNDNKSRNLVYFPDWSFSNPYQKLFYENMQRINHYSDLNIIGLGLSEINSDNLLQILNTRDIVHLHWVHPFILNDKSMNHFCDLLRLIKVQTKSLIVWTVHNMVSHECNDNEEELRRRKYVAKFCDRLIVHSNFAQLNVEKNYGVNRSKIYVIPHGKYDVDSQKTLDLINEYYSARKNMRLTLLGELRAYKNVEFAVDFLSRLNSSLPLENAIELRIAGKSISQDQFDYLHNIQSTHSFISLHLKRLSDDELFHEFCGTDFIFAPYSNSLTSGICINAVSHGRPFIAPKFKALLELHQESNSVLYDNEEELWNELLRCNGLFHRGLLNCAYDPQNIIDKSMHLEWSSIFSSLDRDPFKLSIS